MKNKIIKLAGLAITCMALTACDTEFSNPVGDSSSYSSGDADFSHFVAIGDSLTAGYADGTLYLWGQQNSFPNILSQQFSAVGGGAFVQPLTNDNVGGLIYQGQPILNPITSANMFDNRMVFNAEIEMPERLVGTSSNETEGSGLNGTLFNNMGVPAAKSFHLVTPGYGNQLGLPYLVNPYYARMASTNGASMIYDATGQAAGQAPSFYTLWIGSNDVIWYGFAGGDNATATDQTGNFDPATYGQNDITDPAVFANTYAALVGEFKDENPAVQGVLINVPDVTTIPYFTVVPYNLVPLDKATADALNAVYDATYNDALQDALDGNAIDEAEKELRTIHFKEGQNAPLILDETLTPLGGPETFMRHATADDLIPFEQAPVIGTLADPADLGSVWGVGVPLEDKHVLIPSEIQAMQTAIAAYNATIKKAADADKNLILFDAEALFAELNANGGIEYGTGAVNADYVTGCFFSLDGIHPTARGYAVFANSIINEINSGFNANIPPVDPGAYTTIFVK